MFMYTSSRKIVVVKCAGNDPLVDWNALVLSISEQCGLNLARRSPVSRTERQSSFGTNHSPDLCQMMVIVLCGKVQMIHKPHRLHQARVQFGPCKEFRLKLS